MEHESYAANRLRLTEQVPARHIYLTNGRSRIIRVGPHTLELRHRAPRKLTLLTGMSARVFGALRNIGKANVTSERLMPLRTLLSPKDRRALLFDLTKAPAWMHALANDRSRRGALIGFVLLPLSKLIPTTSKS